ncbi:cell division protein anillin-domain-containing protein [Xylaria bambusicola]|uniref:cell division protein anillin-domain-containing protein n=1 Tax=Xylaria bambusicola TaxID=326684 RepID=UPI002007E838|nr:cell division protein anillin-domain-containing protein [Xylaria bambusicola]KAI0526185.1 cell division protein anillin-domain-containing protein [Xylaria bambusicola]
MASEQPVTEPLRISKSTPNHSPAKGGLSRPLSEISATEKRRNSPSWTSPSKQKMTLSTDSSPFQSSPLEATTSPRLFWQSRNANRLGENDLYSGRSGSPSPTKRSSIERLEKASRVKNSTMFAREQKQEYDPARIPAFERPLAKVQGNAFFGTGHAGLRSNHGRTQSQTDLSLRSPTRSVASPTASQNRPPTPSKDQPSPTKSSLSVSRFKSSYDSQADDVFSDHSIEETSMVEGRYLHRHAKSVTFDAAPPQINEYEMATPDLSSIGTNSREGSFESEEDDDIYEPYHGEDGGLPDDSFDATLEDTDKTPVVGPDDWRRDFDSRFDSSPMPEGTLTQPALARPQQGRTNSSTSSGEHRPLPPLPGMGDARINSASSNGPSAAGERVLSGPRNLPSPPLAATEIQNIGNSNMSLEERLKLMMLSDETSPKQADRPAKTFAEQQRERRMRRAGARDRFASPTPEREAPQPEADKETDEADDAVGDISTLSMDYELPSISRQSILRRVNGNQQLDRESDYNFDSPAPDSSPARSAPYDPDVPIASIEDSVLDDVSEVGEDSVVIKREKDEGERDDAHDAYLQPRDDDEYDDAYSDRSKSEENDSESHYSDESPNNQSSHTVEESTNTPRASSPAFESEITNFSATLPQVNSPTRTSDFSRSFQSYMLPKPKETDQTTHIQSQNEPEKQDDKNRPQTPLHLHPISKPEYDGSGWGEPDEEEEPGTPESVIHHPISDEESYLDDEDDEDDIEEEDEPIESPSIPERMATIRSSGSKLKTRPSATPSDIEAMREARRQVSREITQDTTPLVPPIPDRHRNRMSREFDVEQRNSATGDDFLERHPSFKNRSLTLDLDLGLSLDRDFDRVIEAQKRGYLMRQNTKLVTASDKENEDLRTGTRSAGNSPVKPQLQRPQSWTVEPWNGKQKRSLRKRHGPGFTGPVPPLPGQETNATAMNSVPEEEAEAATEDSGERGRLFVKVMGVKDLDLPLPRNERTWFSLTLDNGVHCVTTAWLELARNAPIGQEFELVVPNDLEFQLTLNVKLEKPKEPKHIPASPIKMSKPKTSTFSRVFASPKKRKEMEARQRAEEEAYAQAQRVAASKLSLAPTAWDLLSPLAAEDGSFARSYVCLKEHEARCYGRPYMVEIAAFNEWATEDAGFASSVKSKRSGIPTNGVVRRAPYKVGKLEVQLLFVPHPKGCTDDDMPKSMNSCIRELKAAEERLSRNWEGHLSQQGGDCPYWRRRYFKLVGTKLTAYHETTRQPRATINLSNAKRLIDDRRQLTNPETTGRNGKRRRSAFAEEEEGYMFVEEGFRIRFNNGEVIDFYADTPEDKEGWMKVLGDVIGRGGTDEDDGMGVNSRRKWCELILKREESLRKRAEGRRVHSRTKSMIM